MLVCPGMLTIRFSYASLVFTPKYDAETKTHEIVGPAQNNLVKDMELAGSVVLPGINGEKRDA